MKLFNSIKKKRKGVDFDHRDYYKKLLDDQTPFTVAEAYKKLRTNLFFTSRGETCPVYAVTSSQPMAGKSVVASNVAVSFAMMNKKVLLIDGDLRAPRLHQIFGVKRTDKGFSTALVEGEKTVNEGISETRYKNLYLMTSGGVSPNPSELLGGDMTASVFAKLRETYDVIIVDTPPTAAVTDAMLLAPYVTGFIIVALAGMSKRGDLRETIDGLTANEGRIVGFVLNDVKEKSSLYYRKRYRSKYEYKYGYKYGYGAYASHPGSEK